MKERNILCYGDSNTWGFVPIIFDYQTNYMARYSFDKRWTGILQKELGNNYRIIEEGLNGRTTNIDYPDVKGRSGTSYLNPCLYSHAPLDLVIIQLGVNDLKTIFNRTIEDIAGGMGKIIEIIQDSNFGANLKEPPKILIASPPLLLNENYLDADKKKVFTGGVQKSKRFHEFFSSLANRKKCFYLDLAKRVKVSEIDGLHLDERGHEKVGKMVASKVISIFK